jgi:hypothetical protein
LRIFTDQNEFTTEAQSHGEKTQERFRCGAFRPRLVFQRWKVALNATGKRFAIVVSRFNAFITERLLLSAIDDWAAAERAKKDID